MKNWIETIKQFVYMLIAIAFLCGLLIYWQTSGSWQTSVKRMTDITLQNMEKLDQENDR